MKRAGRGAHGLIRASVLVLVLATAGCAGSDSGVPESSTTASTAPPIEVAATPSSEPTEATVATTMADPTPVARAQALCARTGTETPGIVQNDDLTEVSGIVASRSSPEVLWAHNDSGPAGVFALDSAGGDLGFHPLGVDAVDIEDMAIIPGTTGSVGDTMLLADIGDNRLRRAGVSIYRFAEPNPANPGPVTDVEVLDFVYPDGAHNAETLLVDQSNNRIVIVTKQQEPNDGGRRDFGATATSLIYEGSLDSDAPRELVAAGTIDTVLLESLTQSTGTHPATFLGFGGVPTGGDVSPDGSLIALRTYAAVWLWPRNDGQSVAEALTNEPCQVTNEYESQGEAIGFWFDDTLVTIGEGPNEPVHRLSR